jgi:glycosyltransferase involved in cell wall biosynthesis
MRDHNVTPSPPVGRPPTFSICIPVYNRERFVRDAIQSVLDQTVQDFEIIVVDDGSTDRTVEAVRSFQDSRIRLVENERNLGITGNCNRCFELVRGRFTGLLYSDDYYRPTMLEAAQSAFETYDVGVFASGATFIHEDGSERNRRHPLLLGVIEPDVYFRSLYELVYCSPPSETFIRSQVLPELGGFDPKVTYIPELDYFLKIAARGHGAYHSAEMLCVRRAWDGAATSQEGVWLQLARDEFRILRRFEKNAWLTGRFVQGAIMTANAHGVRGTRELLTAGRHTVAAHLVALLLGWNLTLRPLRGAYNLVVLGFLAGPVSALARMYAAARMRWARRIVIFGTGTGGRHVFESISPSDKVVAFADNRPERPEATCCGKPVWSVERLLRERTDLVVVADRAGREIKARLVQEGMSPSRIARAEGNRLWGTRFLSRWRERLLLALNRRVVIFGCGVGGARAFEYYRGRNEIVAFADNDPAKQHTSFCGRPVWSPDALLDRPYDLVLLASQRSVPIWHGLAALGVPYQKIVRVDDRVREGLIR